MKREVLMSTNLKFAPKIKIPHDFKYDAVSDLRELMWRCSKCGQLIHRKEGIPEKCPACSASRREFALVEED
jgi:rubrerythrin